MRVLLSIITNDKARNICGKLIVKGKTMHKKLKSEISSLAFSDTHFVWLEEL